MSDAHPALTQRAERLSPSFDALVQAGLDASKRDDVEDALRAWQAAAAVDPAAALPHFLMGAEYAQARRIGEAEAAYANAVLLAPGFEIARYQLGLLQFTSGRAAIAQVTWEPLFRLPDGHPIRDFVRGFAALARDDFDAALACFEAGIAANRSNAAMNADMVEVVSSIRRRREPLDQAPTGGDEPVSDDAHVLLGAYRRQGSMH